MQDTAGRVYVTVDRASGLVPRETAANLYCIVSSDAQKSKTKSVPFTDSDPFWNESFQLNVDKAFSKVEILLWAERQDAAAVFMGRVVLPLVDLCDGQQRQACFMLQPRSDRDDSVCGHIELKLQYRHVRDWDLLYKGIISLKERDYPAAVKQLTEAIAALPEEEYLFSFRSQAHLETQNIKEALADAERILELNPNWSEGYYHKGRAYFAAKDYQRAEDSYNEGLKLNPKDENLLKGLELIKKTSTKHLVRDATTQGKASFLKTDYFTAIQHFTRAINANPFNPAFYMFRAISYMGLAKFEEASADALKIVKLQPDWPKRDCFKEGPLGKKGKMNVLSRPRWFVLKHFFLYYYDSGKDSEPNGVICLSKFAVKGSGSVKLLIFTASRTFKLKAENTRDRNSWVDALEKVRDRPLELPSDESENIIYLKNAAATPAATEDTSRHRSTTQSILKIANSVAKRIDVALTTVSILNSDLDGWLEKQGEIHDSWKRRWFILKGKYLNYFKKEQPRDPENVTPNDRIYKLRAENADGMSKWLSKLSAVCKKGSEYISETFTESSEKVPGMILNIPGISEKAEEKRAEQRAHQQQTESNSTLALRISGSIDGLIELNSEAPVPSNREQEGGGEEAWSYDEPVHDTMTVHAPTHQKTEEMDALNSFGYAKKNDISKAESRYFQRYGLTAPMHEHSVTSSKMSINEEPAEVPLSLAALARSNAQREDDLAAVPLLSEERGRTDYSNSDSEGGCCTACNLM